MRWLGEAKGTASSQLQHWTRLSIVFYPLWAAIFVYENKHPIASPWEGEGSGQTGQPPRKTRRPPRLQGRGKGSGGDCVPSSPTPADVVAPAEANLDKIGNDVAPNRLIQHPQKPIPTQSPINNDNSACPIHHITRPFLWGSTQHSLQHDTPVPGATANQSGAWL